MKYWHIVTYELSAKIIYPIMLLIISYVSILLVRSKRLYLLRKFNCYAGVAPFSYSSGSSQHSKSKVSHRADKTIKRLLHLVAVAITHKTGGELKMYYERKVAEGKNRMSVINALKAKIVSRMFAVVKRNEIYRPFLS